MVDGRLLLEYSKSARAACPLCGSTIPKGVVRIGRESMITGWSQVKWHHPICFGEQHPEADFAQMGGFLSLAVIDQKVLRSIKVSVEKENVLAEAPKVVMVKALAAATNLIDFHPSKLSKSYKILESYIQGAFMQDIRLPEGWKAFSSLILNEADNVKPSEKLAAFDFDGTLVDTSVYRHGAEAWSLLYASIPEKLSFYHDQGYKLVIFTNESNIDRFTKARAKAIDSKLGRLKGFIQTVKLPLQVIIACGKSGCNDLFRKPATGMWHLLEQHLNAGVPIDRERSFYVGDAAGRRTDHSDADIGFATALGLKFLLPGDVFVPTSHVSAEVPCEGDSTVKVLENQETEATLTVPIEPVIVVLEIALPCPEPLTQSFPGTP